MNLQGRFRVFDRLVFGTTAQHFRRDFETFPGADGRPIVAIRRAHGHPSEYAASSLLKVRILTVRFHLRSSVARSIIEIFAKE